MRAFRPAIVYAPLASLDTRLGIEKLMVEKRLHYADPMVERAQDLDLPVTSRPQLLRILPWMKPGHVEAFVLDHESSLGETAAERHGYLGLLLEAGVQVYVAGQRYGDAEYLAARKRMQSDETINEIQRLFTDQSRPEWEAARGVVREEWSPDAAVWLPKLVGFGSGYSDACWRAADLALLNGLTVTAIARRLNLEGYWNKDKQQVVWYARSAARAIEDAKGPGYEQRRVDPAPRRSILEGIL